jgi:hypothetical protein
VHVGGVNDDQFHLVINMIKDPSKAYVNQIPLEIYRYRRPTNGISYESTPTLVKRRFADRLSEFDCIETSRQPQLYQLVRETTRRFPWCGDHSQVTSAESICNRKIQMMCSTFS